MKFKSVKPQMREKIARAIHEDYVRLQKEKGQTPQTNPSMISWNELPENFKESNRQQADHISIKLNAVGCEVAPLNDRDAELFKFTPEEIELLAEKEHERWVEERKLDGWKPGQTKDIEKKISPYLVSWDQLTEEIKEYDRNTVRSLPAFLASAGFGIYRLK